MCSKPPQMPRSHNNSDQMAQVLQPDRSHRPRDESGNEERQGSSSSASASASVSTSASSSLASSSSPSYCSPSALPTCSPITTFSAPSSHGATRPWGEPSPTQRDFGPTTCTLDKMKKLPQSQCHLGPLMFKRAHTVLINVRPWLPISLSKTLKLLTVELRFTSGLDRLVRLWGFQMYNKALHK